MTNKKAIGQSIDRRNDKNKGLIKTQTNHAHLLMKMIEEPNPNIIQKVTAKMRHNGFLIRI